MDVALFKKAATDLHEACDGLDKMFRELTMPCEMREQGNLILGEIKSRATQLENYSGDVIDNSASDLMDQASVIDSLSAWAGLMTDEESIGALNRVADFFRSLAQEKMKSE